MNRRLYVLALGALSACGRFSFDGITDAGDGSVGDDASIDSPGPNAAGCSLPPHPDVSGPAVTVGTGTSASCGGAALQAALNLGGMIDFDCGPALAVVPVASEFSITKSVTLVGNPLVRFDGGDATRMFNVNAPGATVTMVGVDLRHGHAADNGGAIRVLDGDLVVWDSYFEDNRSDDVAAAGGGAIAEIPVNGTIAIYRSSVVNNHAASGGAVMAFNDLTIMASEISGNSAFGSPGGTGGLGGAIEQSGTGDLTLCGNRFSGNVANDFGGAIHRVCVNSLCAVTIEETDFEGNISNGATGGVYVQNSTLQIRQSSFYANRAFGSLVGGLWVIGGISTNIENAYFGGNTAVSGSGAGVSIAGPGTISTTTIAENSTDDVNANSGGFQGNSMLSLYGVIIANNRVPGAGAQNCGIQMMDGTASLQFPAEVSLCAPNVQLIDPAVHGVDRLTGPNGSFPAQDLMLGSPALRLVMSGCPAEDLLGNPRGAPCAAGAIETAK